MAVAPATVRTLKTVVFIGSARNITPPWGGDARLGDRVIAWVTNTLKAREATVGTGTEKIKHDVTLFDPREVFGEGGALASSGAQLTTPHFYFKGGSAPAEMDAMRDTIKAADCYIVARVGFLQGSGSD